MRRVAIGLFAALAVGCGKYGDSPTGLVPVKGKVVGASGSAVGNVQVMFYPTAPGGTTAGGTAGADGKFVVKSLNNEDGMLPGTYKVTVVPWKAKGTPGKLPEKYAEEHTTTLTAEVSAETPEVTIKLN
jgi:hypothetical protein